MIVGDKSQEKALKALKDERRAVVIFYNLKSLFIIKELTNNYLA